MYIILQCTHFQALQYLRKLCNHPTLVVNHDHPMYEQVQDYLESNSTTLTDIKHAAKLTALKLVNAENVNCDVLECGYQRRICACSKYIIFLLLMLRLYQ